MTVVRVARGAARRARNAARLAVADLRLRAVVRQVARTTRTSDTAIVVHLHYPEVWPVVSDRLALLPTDLDLFVTVTRRGWEARDEILARTPRARIIRTPNVGRDVLPFIRVAAGLHRAGYRAVLKLHGKRSVHADDGAAFLDACLTELIASAEAADRCRLLVETGEAAVVGPASRLYPLAIHVWLNIADLRWFFSRHRPGHVDLLSSPTDLSFFAGTMFWAQLEAIVDCLDVPTSRFQVEDRQIDGTMAHALERLLTVVPEVDGRQVAVSDGSGPRPVHPTDHQWPAWALRKPEWE